MFAQHLDPVTGENEMARAPFGTGSDGGGGPAYASWTAIPGPVDAADTAAVVKACRDQGGTIGVGPGSNISASELDVRLGRREGHGRLDGADRPRPRRSRVGHRRGDPSSGVFDDEFEFDDHQPAVDEGEADEGEQQHRRGQLR